MGIVYSLIRVRPETVDALRNQPRNVAEFVYGDASLYEAPKPSLMARLFGSGPTSFERATPHRRDGDEIDLDKSWHVVHYLLTGSEGGSESPLNIIADEREKLAAIDFGLGPPFVVDAMRVSQVAAAISEVSDERFLSKLQPSEMPLDALYLGASVAADPEEMSEYALEKFHALFEFLHEAAKDGDAVITYYS